MNWDEALLKERIRQKHEDAALNRLVRHQVAARRWSRIERVARAARRRHEDVVDEVNV